MDRCPVCKTEWKITKFGKKEWKDCSKCGKTEEDLIAMETLPGDHPMVHGIKKSTMTKEEEDLIEQFEKTLRLDSDGDDWDAPGEVDDQDDFGLFQP
jgi:hypothetical protein